MRNINGKVMYDAGDVAQLSERHWSTIRTWATMTERGKGFIPSAIRYGGRRYWTKEQVDEIVEISNGRRKKSLKK